MTLAERFWTKVRRTSEGCWEWSLCRNRDGYGIFSIRRGKLAEVGVLAHRWAYFLTKGTIPADKRVLHKCDNPACCRPDHLFLGTCKDNSVDMVKKNRGPLGEKHGRHKLTDEQVAELRRQRAAGKNRAEVAREFGISLSWADALYYCYRGQRTRLTPKVAA